MQHWEHPWCARQQRFSSEGNSSVHAFLSSQNCIRLEHKDTILLLVPSGGRWTFRSLIRFFKFGFSGRASACFSAGILPISLPARFAIDQQFQVWLRNGGILFWKVWHVLCLKAADFAHSVRRSQASPSTKRRTCWTGWRSCATGWLDCCTKHVHVPGLLA